MKHLTLILLLLSTAPLFAGEEQKLSQAIEQGLRRLETAATNYTKNRQCFSCHHQSLPVMAMVSARAKGFKVDEEILKQQVAYSLKSLAPKVKEIAQGTSLGGGNTMAVYGLETLVLGGHANDEVMVSLVKFLLARQKENGSWPPVTSRPPTEGSKFTTAFFALKNLRGYVFPKTDDAVADEKIGKSLDQARNTGIAWLEGAEPETTEDQVFHLRSLVLIEAKKERIEKARSQLLGRQLANGSWAQLLDMEGDAYATGTVLVALKEAGVETNSKSFQNGIEFLLKTQESSGAWIVKTRSRPIQTYFDNGDPGGKSQFISTAATGWAVLGLLECVPTKK